MLALQHALLILAANRSLNQSGCLAVVTQQHQHPRIFLTRGLRCLPGSSFCSHQHCEGALLIDLTFEQDGNCEENRCLTVVTWWHLHWCPSFGTVSSKFSPGWLSCLGHCNTSVFPYWQIKMKLFAKTAWVNEIFSSHQSERNLVIATVGKN